MKLNFWKQFLSAIVLTVAVCGVANAQLTDLRVDFRNGAGDLGALLDQANYWDFCCPRSNRRWR